MNSDQWRRVETIYHAALEREIEARPSFLKDTCSDEQVRLEVAALLRYDGQAKSFMETPALRRAARELAGNGELELNSLPPREIGPYRLLAPIGSGGMGEVHLALDTRLNRKVAIKLLPSAFTPETELGRRFKQEARTASALSHPNIVTVFEVGELKERHYIVSEYVEGDTLRQLINSKSKKELEPRSALAIAVQVARALEAAHQLGIIHRDIKPENVIVRKDGLVKVLDFGLAKLNSEEDNGSQSQQLLTRSGVVMGTAAYMSPEQARGQKIDHRADIFSFGAMTYEMLSGERPFAGATTSDVIAAVLVKDPDPLSKVAPQVRTNVASVIHRCLEKQPEKRFQSAGELASKLQDLITSHEKSEGLLSTFDLSSVIPAAAVAWQRIRQRPKYLVATAFVAMVLITIATLGVIRILNVAAERPAVAFSFSLPQGWGFRRSDLPALSPDGRMIVFSAFPMNDRVGQDSALWIRGVESGEAITLMGTEGGAAAFWSPDSRYVAFWQQDILKKVEVSSGTISTIFGDSSLTEARTELEKVMQVLGFRNQSAGTWGAGDTILVSIGSRLARMSAAGGPPELLNLSGGENGQYNPRFLPDGRQFLYYSRNKNRQDDGIYLSSLDSVSQRKLILQNATAATYVADDYLLFSREGQLLAQHFDLKRLEVSGDVLNLATSIRKYPDQSSPIPLAAFSASDNGVLVWRPAEDGEEPLPITTRLTWFDRSGKRLGAIGNPAGFSGPAFSPDERNLVVGQIGPGDRGRDLWIFDPLSGGSSRFTADPADEFNPVWSPDGKWIYFTAERNGVRNIYRKLANGTGSTEPVLEIKEEWNIEDISADGRFLVTNSRAEKQNEPDLTIMSVDNPRKQTKLANSAAREDHAQFSPNGRWIAYRSAESGNSEILVRGLMPNGIPSHEKFRVSTKGGDQPRWSGDGKELFFIADSTLMVVDIEDKGTTIVSGSPRPLFKLNIDPQPRRNRYLVSRDGQRILTLSMAEPITGSTIAAQLNWPATLKK